MENLSRTSEWIDAYIGSVNSVQHSPGIYQVMEGLINSEEDKLVQNTMLKCHEVAKGKADFHILTNTDAEYNCNALQFLILMKDSVISPENKLLIMREVLSKKGDHDSDYKGYQGRPRNEAGDLYSMVNMSLSATRQVS